MKKSNLMKVVSILLISLIVMLFVTTVNAADTNEGFNDLTSTLTNNPNNTNSPSNNTNTPNNASLMGNNTNTNNTNNSSVYNNTNLPATGIADSIPVAVLFVVFVISAVYAYKKINDYKDI